MKYSPLPWGEGGGGGNGCLRKDGIKEPTRRGGSGLARALIFYIYYNTLLDGRRDTLELPHPATALPTLSYRLSGSPAPGWGKTDDKMATATSMHHRRRDKTTTILTFVTSF